MNAGRESKLLVGLGSNIEPERHIPLAIQSISKVLKFLRASRFYRTEPVGRKDQSDFINGCILLSTDLSPHTLKYEIFRPIEERLGRKRSGDRYGPRTIDIDILLYGDMVVKEEGIVIPDPELLHRDFLLVPAKEIAGDMVHPVTGKRLSEIPVDMGRLEPVFIPIRISDAQEDLS